MADHFFQQVRLLLALPATLENWWNLSCFLEKHRSCMDQPWIFEYVEKHLSAWSPEIKLAHVDWHLEHICHSFVSSSTHLFSSTLFNEAIYLEENTPNDEPHTIWFQKTLVSQEEWQKIMKTQPSFFQQHDLPVEQVSWLDALIFCNRLSMQEGLTPFYSFRDSEGNRLSPLEDSKAIETVSFGILLLDDGYRLPTQREFEMAVRQKAESTPHSLLSNTEPQPLAQKPSIAKKKETGWGDLFGNLSQWGNDFHNTQEIQPSWKMQKIQVMGSSWNAPGFFTEHQPFRWHRAKRTHFGLGFRCVRLAK